MYATETPTPRKLNNLSVSDCTKSCSLASTN